MYRVYLIKSKINKIILKWVNLSYTKTVLFIAFTIVEVTIF